MQRREGGRQAKSHILAVQTATIYAQFLRDAGISPGSRQTAWIRAGARRANKEVYMELKNGTTYLWYESKGRLPIRIGIPTE